MTSVLVTQKENEKIKNYFLNFISPNTFNNFHSMNVRSGVNYDDLIFSVRYFKAHGKVFIKVMVKSISVGLNQCHVFKFLVLTVQNDYV